MERQILMENIRNILDKSGFALSDIFVDRSICFDIIARRDEKLLIIKVHTNIDSFSNESANELMVISKLLEGSPLVIGNHSGAGCVEDGAVYLRHGVPIMSPQTMHDYFYDEFPPVVFAAPGGFFVKIDGNSVRKAREAQGISLGTLADAIGVSRRAVQMYEDGMSAMVDIAIKLQDYLNEPIILPSDPLNVEFETKEFDRIKSELKFEQKQDKDVITHLQVLGYEVTPTKRSPFDALTAKQKVLILTGIEKHPKYIKQRAKIIHNISELADKHSVFFIRKIKTVQNIEGIPTIALEELIEMDDSDEILELIQKRA
jgi:putative transcriptional regulator